MENVLLRSVIAAEDLLRLAICKRSKQHPPWCFISLPLLPFLAATLSLPLHPSLSLFVTLLQGGFLSFIHLFLCLFFCCFWCVPSKVPFRSFRIAAACFLVYPSRSVQPQTRTTLMIASKTIGYASSSLQPRTWTTTTTASKTIGYPSRWLQPRTWTSRKPLDHLPWRCSRGLGQGG